MKNEQINNGGPGSGRLSSGWLGKPYPRNFVIRRPFWGGLVIGGFTFLFAMLYRPSATHSSGTFSYPFTMAFYSLLIAASVIIAVGLIKFSKYFGTKNRWTFRKELLSIVIVLVAIGLGTYLAGFLIEPPGDRLNWPTLADSFINALLVGILPLSFFTLINYWHLFQNDHETSATPAAELKQEKIRITSTLKKEELSFYPDELLYATSDGNYVNFYLHGADGIQRKIIRNSISDVEKQLRELPQFFRSHRAYIVNLEKIAAKHGNTAGYRLLLDGSDVEIPVSRQKVKTFDRAFETYSS